MHVAAAGADQRRRADRGQRQRGRHPRGPAGGDELAAGQPAGHRRVGVPAHGPVRRGAAGRAARGAGPAAAAVPARADRPGLAAGQRHRAGSRPVRRAVADVRRPGRLPGRRVPGGHSRDPPGPGRPAADHRRDVIVPEHAGTGARETVVSAGRRAAAASDWFRSRRSSAADPAATANGSGHRDGRGAAGRAARGPQATGTDEWAVGRHAAQIIAEPVRGDITAAGLPTRVPQANLIPGSAGGGRRAGAAAPAGRDRATKRRHRPRRGRRDQPDVARNRLSGFQRGVRRAKGPSPRPADTGEGAEPLSYAYRQDLNWLVTDFTARVADVAHAAVVSADGVPLALSERHPRRLRRPARGHHLRADQPDAGRGAALRGGPSHPGPGGDGRRADVRHGHQRRVEPGRPGRSGVRHGSGVLRDDAAGRGGRRRADACGTRAAGILTGGHGGTRHVAFRTILSRPNGPADEFPGRLHVGPVTGARRNGAAGSRP